VSCGYGNVVSAQSSPASYPVKPIRLVIPWPAGGPSDVIGRVFAEPLAKVLGQPIVIDNRGGAGGVLGTEAAAKAAPDGYTFLFTLSSHTINPLLYKLSFDIERDFTPVTLIVSVPQLIAAYPGAHINSLWDVVAMAKAHPEGLHFASVGNGTPSPTRSAGRCRSSSSPCRRPCPTCAPASSARSR
jgi:tripartite-type tricarboxylate transporter receptor subunit TctC